MIAHKNITKIVGVLMATAVLVCMLAVACSQKVAETVGGNVVAMQYESELFHTDEIIQIDIQMEKEEWENMLVRAIEEEYYSCDVVIDGQEICNVGIRPKGNTSLSSIAMDPETDRYSLKLEFDHYVEGQNCFGLDKLILNNNYADATNMKEAVIYDMYQYLGADASLYNYAEVSVNGEYWGVYLALEAIEESFLLRNYGTEDGELYKPESMGMGGEPNGQERPEMPTDGDGMPEMPTGAEGEPFGSKMPEESIGEERVSAEGEISEKQENMSERFGNHEGAPGEGFASRGFRPPEMEDFEGFDRENFERHDKGEMLGGGFSVGDGADLNYTDDELDSYSTIWEGEVTNTGDKDHSRVVTALKNISEGKDIEEYLDVDNVLKYMAVHAFSVNMDSLSGNMAHNYFLYEYDGKLNILPWDYNLSFGGMGMDGGNSASGMINDAIDTPFQGTEFFDALLENEEYLSQYHTYLSQLVEEYVFGGRFEETYNRIRNQIDSLVETDPTAFYSYKEYEAGADMLYQTVLLRAESIQGQLDGRIPSTDEGQRTDASELVDASEITIEVMGGFDRGSRNEEREMRREK